MSRETTNPPIVRFVSLFAHVAIVCVLVAHIVAATASH